MPLYLLTLFAKLLGVVREMVQANIFGTGVDANNAGSRMASSTRAVITR